MRLATHPATWPQIDISVLEGFTSGLVFYHLEHGNGFATELFPKRAPNGGESLSLHSCLAGPE